MVTLARRLSDASAAARRLRAAQRGLLRFLLRDLRVVMPRLNPAEPASAAPWIADVGAVVARYARMSAELSARSYDAERTDARLRAGFRAPLAEPPPEGQVEASLRWAAHSVWSPPAPTEDLAPTETETYSSQIAARLLAQVQSRTDAAASKLVLDTGRQTVVQAVQRDPGAVGWYRASDGEPCAFCALMVSRGAVYKTRGTAGADASERFAGDGQFKFHDHCGCMALPVLRGDTFALSESAARWDDVYQTYAAGHSGDQLRRFRVALRVIREGRTPVDEDFSA